MNIACWAQNEPLKGSPKKKLYFRRVSAQKDKLIFRRCNSHDLVWRLGKLTSFVGINSWCFYISSIHIQWHIFCSTSAHLKFVIDEKKIGPLRQNLCAKFYRPIFLYISLFYGSLKQKSFYFILALWLLCSRKIKIFNFGNKSCNKSSRRI